MASDEVIPVLRVVARGRRLLVAMAMIVTVAGCGGGSPAATPPTALHGVITVPTPADTVDPELLAIGDMPAGWSVDESASDQSDPSISDNRCKNAIAHANTALKQRTVGFGEADFASDPTGSLPSLDETLGRYPDRTTAQAAFSNVTESYSRCRSYVVTMNGVTASIALKRMSFPKFGDGSTAYQVELTVSGALRAGGGILIALYGSQLMTVSYSSSDQSATSGLQTFSKLAASKLR